MSRRLVWLWRVVVALVVVGLLPVTAIPLAGQEAPTPDDPTTTTAPVPPPTASIVVDATTGAVLASSNPRQPLSPASTSKIITALLVRDRLPIDAEITISNIVASAPPRRLRLAPGSRWNVRDLLYASLHCSCNDAAWALGQAAGGGTMEGFEAESQVLARDLSLSDAPVLRDPAGLDNDRSIRGGNLISARDLAIAARAFLADPELAAIAAAPGHEWIGGDGESHSVTNLDQFLARYEGAIGIKTGFTKKAGLTFAAAARRGGRTLIAVVLDSDANYAHARELLDRGFLLAAAGQVTDDTLPAVPDDLVAGASPSTTTSTTTTPTTAPSSSTSAATSATSSSPPDSTGVGGGDGGGAVDPLWLGAGGGVVVVGAGAAVLARRRTRSPRSDQRPARPRRRARRRPSLPGSGSGS